MGGTSHDDSHFLMLDLCRECHDRAHMKLTIFNRYGDLITWADTDGDSRGERALTLPMEESDEYLATLWGEAQALGARAIIKQAYIANKFRAKYGGFDHWWVRVADIIRETTGLSVSVGVVYDRAALGIALNEWTGDPLDFLEQLGVKASAAVGRAIMKGSDGAAVIEDAMDTRLDATRTATAKKIRQSYLGEQPAERCDHICSLCGENW